MMKKVDAGASSCRPDSEGSCSCSVEAVLSVDERGQMVLPKAMRTALGVENGGKLAAVTMQQGQEMCCVTLMRTDRLDGMARSFLSPIVSAVFGEKGNGE